jgi:methylmalonyl-CoA/ethylmalonyl-CoA epimerase
MKLAHIGIAVIDSEKSSRVFGKLLGKAPSQPVEILDQHLRIQCFRSGEVEIELLEGLGEKSPIFKFLGEKRKDTLHHIAFKTANFDDKLKELKGEGFRIIDGYPRKGKDGTKIAFLHPEGTGGVLLELIEAV